MPKRKSHSCGRMQQLQQRVKGNIDMRSQCSEASVGPWARQKHFVYIYIYILILIPNPDQNLRRHCLHQKIARSERPSNLKHSFGLSVLLQCCLGFAQSKQLFLKVFCLHQCAKFNWEVDRPKTTPTQTDTLRTPLMLKYLWVRSLDRYNSTD